MESLSDAQGAIVFSARSDGRKCGLDLSRVDYATNSSEAVWIRSRRWMVDIKQVSDNEEREKYIYQVVKGLQWSNSVGN